jgi:hypothetical protein
MLIEQNDPTGISLIAHVVAFGSKFCPFFFFFETGGAKNFAPILN